MSFKKASFYISFFVFLFVLGKASFAAGIKVSPVKISEIVEPGDILKAELEVTNISNGLRDFNFYINDFKAKGEGGSPILVPFGSNDPYSLASWIKITDKKIVLKPNESKKIPFKIIVPKTASPGAHYGAIVVASFPPNIKKLNTERGAVLGISQQVGSLILLNVLGEINEKAILLNFDTDKKFYSIPFNVNFSIRVKDEGNVLIKPQGFITVTNILGEKVKTIRVNEEGSNILPNTIRKLEESWQGKFAFGKYTASLVLSFGIPVEKGGQGKQSLYAQTSFWIIPLRLILYGSGGLIILLIIFVVFIKIYKKKVIEKVLKEAGVEKTIYVKKYQGGSPGFHLSVFGLLVLLGIIFLILSAVIIFFLFFA